MQMQHAHTRIHLQRMFCHLVTKLRGLMPQSSSEDRNTPNQRAVTVFPMENSRNIWISDLLQRFIAEIF